MDRPAACQFLGTASSSQVVGEALGLSLPHAALAPSAAIIWQRFPKFVLGFVFVSVLASLGLFSKEAVGVMKTLSKWAFAMAFFSIGLELSVKELGEMGWPPVLVYIAATVFNTLLAMGVAWVIFGVLKL